MKHLKSYKLFEQIETRNQFPDFNDFEELLFDLSDDNIISKANFISSGYFIYPKYEILHTYKRDLRSAISYDMSVNPDGWQNKKCELIYDETYGSIFLKNQTSRVIGTCGGSCSGYNKPADKLMKYTYGDVGGYKLTIAANDPKIYTDAMNYELDFFKKTIGYRTIK